jgi:hypothetical protein
MDDDHQILMVLMMLQQLLQLLQRELDTYWGEQDSEADDDEVVKIEVAKDDEPVLAVPYSNKTKGVDENHRIHAGMEMRERSLEWRQLGGKSKEREMRS